MSARHTLTALLAATIASLLTPFLGAAVIVPVKPYVKPDEPVNIRFLDEKGEEGKKALAALGLEATKLDNLFTPASDTMNADGTPAVKLYADTAGDAIKPAAVKVTADGILDLAAAFPQIKEAGTYYIVWKDAPPLVVEVLRNPVPWQYAKDTSVPAADRAGIIQEFTTGQPVITHIVPLQYAVITTDKGVIKAKFSYDVAPHTIDNFIDLANQKMYDNSGFHRIIKGFMIQGGDSLANDPARAGTGGPGYNLPAELSGKKHEKGTLSMARMGFSVDTAGAQFFIMHGKTPSLDGDYTAFGDVFDGMDIVDKIANTPAEKGSGAVALADRPKIISIRILPATPDIYGLKK